MSAGLAALAQVTRSLNELARVPSQAAAEASGSISSLIQKEFDSGMDPYDRAWAPLEESTIAHGRSAPPLTDSGSMRQVSVTPSQGAGIRIEIGEAYSAFHQGGTRFMEARPILPTSGLPATWNRSISDAVERAAARAMGGGR